MFTVAYDEAGETKRHALKPGTTTVGRAPNCDVLVNHSSVSRVHARFKITGDQCVLEDAGSRNGTYVNDVQITSAAVKDRDQLSIGDVVAWIEVSAEDKLSLVDGSSAKNYRFVVDRPVDQTPSTPPTVDPARLLALISSISKSLVKEQPLSDVLEEVVRLTMESTAADRAFLILQDEKTGRLVPRVVHTRNPRAAARGTVSRTVVNRVMTERVAMLASNAQADQRFDGVESIAALKIGAFMCVPLWNQASTIGALYLDTYFAEQFSAADLELLTALSNYAAVAIEQARLTSRLQQETRRRERLGRYHSPAVVARIIEDGNEAGTPFLAQERDLTVMFADIVGFTTMAEKMAPQQVATILNACLGRLTDVIFQYEGTLDKFIGDGLLAVFGAPLDQPDHAIRAVGAARAIRRAVKEMNDEQTGPPLQMRIALNSGIALAGDIGSPTRREYTVLGDVVNTASRVESTVAGPDQIVITRPTFDRLDGTVQTRSLGPVMLRGRRDSMEVFEVLG
jgi:adenylate cyclase